MKTNIKLAPEGYLSAVRKRRNKQVRRVLYGTSGLLLLIITFVSSTNYGQTLLSSIALAQETDEEYYEEEYYDEGYYEDYDVMTEGGCNVLGLSLYGDIYTTGTGASTNAISSYLETYGQHENLKAIVVDVDSGGGSPVAGDEILQLLEDQTVPVVAQIRELGASAAYMAILSADHIIAHPYSSVGSIGVIQIFYDYTKFNKKEGIEYIPIQSGPGKDAGTGERSLTREEIAQFQEEVDYLYDGFIDQVAFWRDLSRDAVLQAADGRTFMAPKALELGLIDEMGGSREVRAHLASQIGEEPVICWVNNEGY